MSWHGLEHRGDRMTAPCPILVANTYYHFYDGAALNYR